MAKKSHGYGLNRLKLKNRKSLCLIKIISGNHSIVGTYFVSSFSLSHLRTDRERAIWLCLWCCQLSIGRFVALNDLHAQRFPTHKFLREFSCLVSLRRPNIVSCRAIKHHGAGRYLLTDYRERRNFFGTSLGFDISLS